MDWFEPDKVRFKNLTTSWVMPRPGRCVQCGMCSFNCPMGIDVRRQAWRGEPVVGACLACGECVRRCPRGLLQFEPIAAARRARRRRVTAPGRRRHVLIGTGAAAMAAAEAIRAEDAEAEIVVLGADPHGFYSRPGLAYLLTREVPERRLFPFAQQDFDRIRAVVLAERVTRIDPAAHQVTLQSGRRLPYDRLLIATGSMGVRANVPGENLDGVIKLDDMEDARRLIRSCQSAKAAVVVGGGITALEIVEGLRARRVRVHYFLRRDRFWPNVLSASESKLIEDGLQREGVEIHPHTELAQVIGKRGRVAGVETADGTRIRCQVVAVAIGVQPQVQLAGEASLACERGVVVDEHLRTSDPDIYAAGDVAEVFDPAAGHRTLHVLWNTAVEKGRIAGRNMASGPLHTYQQRTPLNVTRLAGLPTTIIGTVGSGDDADLKALARGDSQVWSELKRAVVAETLRDGAHIRLALREGVVVGAVVIGEQTLSFSLQRLVEGKVDVASLGTAAGAIEVPIAELARRASHSPAKVQSA